jgi:hypothetical protein
MHLLYQVLLVLLVLPERLVLALLPEQPRPAMVLAYEP